MAFPSKFTKKSREVFLEGEAYFEVAKNQTQPFIVNAAKIEIKVLGTHFNVSAYPADQTIETVLLEGSVALSRPNSFGSIRNEIILQPNQKGSFSKEEKEMKVSDEPDVDLYVAWTYGWLKYNKESLGSVLGKVERYYNIEIQIPENYPKDDKITGKLDLKDSLERVMVVLADATGFTYRISGNKVFIDKEMKTMPR